MKRLMLLAFLMLAGCDDGRDPKVVDAQLWYNPGAETELYCPEADEAFLQSEVEENPVILARCYWRCATWTDGGLESAGALLLTLHDNAPAWAPEPDYQVIALQDERCN